jgi:hypothetical protein
MSDQDPERPILDPKTTDALMRMLIGALLFRLGGEETFTEPELDEIMKSVGGVQILYVPGDPDRYADHPMNRYVLRVRGSLRAAEIAEKGFTI